LLWPLARMHEMPLYFVAVFSFFEPRSSTVTAPHGIQPNFAACWVSRWPENGRQKFGSLSQKYPGKKSKNPQSFPPHYSAATSWASQTMAASYHAPPPPPEGPVPPVGASSNAAICLIFCEHISIGLEVVKNNHHTRWQEFAIGPFTTNSGKMFCWTGENRLNLTPRVWTLFPPPPNKSRACERRWAEREFVQPSTSKVAHVPLS